MTNDYHRLPDTIPRANVVPWYGKTWSEINDQGYMPQLEQHLIELTKQKGKQRAEEYVKYLKTMGGIKPLQSSDIDPQ